MTDISIFDSIKRLNESIQADTRLEDDFNSEPDVLSADYLYGTNIYKLFDGLTELFQRLGLIAEHSNQNDSRFKFIHAYPDSVYDDNSNIITYTIDERRPLKVQSNSVPTARAVTKVKPTFVTEQVNDITGNVENIYRSEFDNIISIRIFSGKARILNNLARILESIFIKYSSYIKQYVDEFLYLGMGPITYLDRYDEQDPIYSRVLKFHCITTEFYKLELEQVKNIRTQFNNK